MIIYSIVIFLSAFLLFQIQPIISRFILPWFGGTPTVWSTAQLFFQILLLGGYAYSHLLTVRWSPHRQTTIHSISLLVAAIFIILMTIYWGVPILPDDRNKPDPLGDPIIHILLILLLGVGLPFFLLSTTGPLLQNWFRLTEKGRSPYHLYALSNAGSMIALISYPFIVEPVMRLKTQAWIWGTLFLIFLFFVGYCAARVRFHLKDVAYIKNIDIGSTKYRYGKLKNKSLFYWTILASIGSTMLLAITNQISQEVAVFPFLWILPLALYLLTFILCFSSEKWYSRNFIVLGLSISTALFLLILINYPMNIIIQVILYAALLFFGCMVCHGELYKSRPSAVHLTTFYLMVSLGGALGGLFVNLIAPHIFKGFWELHLSLILLYILLIYSLIKDSSSIMHGKRFWITAPILLGLFAFLTTFSMLIIRTTVLNVNYISRNFYGIIRVWEPPNKDPSYSKLTMSHGVTLHGYQFRSDELKTTPTSYYGNLSGISKAIVSLRWRQQSSYGISSLRVGVVGLGVGTLAAYGQEGDYFRFYEINPDVINIAQGENAYFSYLSDTDADYEIILGDGRLSLENELLNENNHFDILIMDAFSDGAVPTHLLTKEAFSIYFQHLNPDGVLAVNVSNHHLDLVPIVVEQGDYFGYNNVLIRNNISDEANTPSSWIILSKDSSIFESPYLYEYRSNYMVNENKIKQWTDDYISMYRIIIR
jgi:hypothetical protein